MSFFYDIFLIGEVMTRQYLDLFLAAVLLIGISCNFASCRNDKKKEQDDSANHLELSDDEIALLLSTLLLPRDLDVSLMNALIMFDNTNVSLAVRVRIKQERLGELYQSSWLKSNNVEASELSQYRMNIAPGYYQVTWWTPLPIQEEDETFQVNLKKPDSGYIMLVVHKINGMSDLYFFRSSLREHFDSKIITFMRKAPGIRGSSPIPPRIQMHEMRKGNF